jgi:hypothetical protein
MQLIPQWRVWYKRWSTWLLGMIGLINLNDILGWLPSVQQYMDPVTYKYAMIGLSVAVFVAMHIPQKSVSGPKV